MTLLDDARSVFRPWKHAPKLMIALYTAAAYRVFVPHPGNNDFRKITASGLMGTWIIITLGIAFNAATLGTIQYGALTAIVYTIIGIQWGFEIDSLSPIEISVTDHSQDDDDAD